ncbi:caspase family protein [Algibacter luteus]|uniref:caspase family protein n=1 Tax=Algibacter luteus TaxID=1178825 RepID=UPI002599D91E|nr:caspase family protein [Algibacter luteus]WJJ96539.1 caspase family protein [Algibacter luteus]
MRIGILIGISEYEHYNNLPGCDNDIKAISEVLNTSKEFDEIKIFEKNVESSKIKSELSKLFEDWKSQDVEELFFYFSGHGSFISNEFYYILSDFDENQKRQTSLQNSEIDSMIKSIKPKMVTKVIDACQSGVSYIKGNTNIVEKYYHKTADSFDKCYFLHSSMTSQYSYQNNELSDFTKSFLKAIDKSDKPSIRYKDIIDYISDEFEKSTEQTPFFITQADHTERFLATSPELQKVISKYVKESNKETDNSKDEEVVVYNSYIEKIKKDAEIYSNKDEVETLLNEVKDVIETTDLQTELKELYCYKNAFEHNLRYLPKGTLIARWLEDNPNEYFAKADYDKIPYQEEETRGNPFGQSLASMMRGNKIVTKYRSDLKGFEQQLDIPFKYATIDFVPLFPNLKQHALLLTFIISKKDIKFFYAFTEYNETDWTRKEIIKNFKWSSSDFLIKENKQIFEFIKKTMLETENKLLSIVKERFENRK